MYLLQRLLKGIFIRLVILISVKLHLEEMQKPKLEHHVKLFTYIIDYAAPEVWKGDIYSWPCDIWSIGCITYELAAQ